ncbi:EAL domain-containing protein [Yersinia pekkanenii]|uniref:Sensory box/GGDEF family protein n=1 Tax=Yersinia pekkanenii TaxID=1288385 RepID=A0A0T9QQA9_9GAMM|nr:EAL domain-containing protein [Yersinia pekkanenii]CNI22010.1 sensory box/GGDEF family protein [Yersinia pekkanenii]CRY66317.1 sensory box/GGDEF family protein [Yersinia pekkanenii]
MRVRRSLTIKQMAAVTVVALVTICIFIVIQLFHFVQQRKDDYARQLESIAYSVRQPLSEAILSVDIPQAKKVLNSLLPIGILSRAEVILPNQIQVLHANFPTERPVPRWAKHIFSLPIQITIPLYALERVSANPQPLAHLVLRADSFRMYQFILSALSAMLSTYLLLALVLSVSIAWCINRLIIHPLRAMAKELEKIGQQGVLDHQLTLPAHHQDDELGVLVHNYNRNQQLLVEAYTDMSRINAHHQGQDQTMVFEPHLTEKMQKRLIQENDILQAIENRDFVLFLQPQWDMQEQRVIGAEALLRWRQADGSYRLPSEFILDAEESGAMMPLGSWVLDEACRILADWKAQGITLSLAVNISGLQVQCDHILTHLQTIISRYHIDLQQLVLEITETARIQNLDNALMVLRKLRGLGLSIALDDFGTGYSSLQYLNHLKSLPINMIKLDKSFVKHLPEDAVMARIIATIAEVLNLRVMAEGVETDEQCQWLLKHGIHCGQGFLFSQPLPREEFEARYTLRP